MNEKDRAFLFAFLSIVLLGLAFLCIGFVGTIAFEKVGFISIAPDWLELLAFAISGIGLNFLAFKFFPESIQKPA